MTPRTTRLIRGGLLVGMAVLAAVVTRSLSSRTTRPAAVSSPSVEESPTNAPSAIEGTRTDSPFRLFKPHAAESSSLRLGCSFRILCCQRLPEALVLWEQFITKTR